VQHAEKTPHPQMAHLVLSTHEPTLKKPKEPFLANPWADNPTENINFDDYIIETVNDDKNRNKTVSI
jgi:hypothetical protein